MYTISKAQPMLGAYQVASAQPLLGLGAYYPYNRKPLYRSVFGQTPEGTAVALGTGAMVLSAVISFALMTGAAYLGARWAGCGK